MKMMSGDIAFHLMVFGLLGFSGIVSMQIASDGMFAGDFAMLLNAGMSAKQALVYNCVSSLLCMMGMVFGVAIGNISSATLWIFALIAGLFLYVALVDMVVTCLLILSYCHRENLSDR